MQRQHSLESFVRKFTRAPALAFALCLAAAGRHHVLLAGSPGCGKTFALRHFKELLPTLRHEERIEVALVHGRAPEDLSERPFRSPHHSASAAALLGGSLLQPGEVSLAHHGTLFLDELAEFPRSALEALREPLDEHKISLARARGRVELPAHFQLLAATNPCACGYVFSRTRQCRCSVGAPSKYQQKLSGPLLERFSILLLVDDLVEKQGTLDPDLPLDTAAHLRALAVQWMAWVEAEPQRWCEQFLQTQRRLWSLAASTDGLSPELVSALHARAQKSDWSNRTIQRVTDLLVTLTSLLTPELSNALTDEQWLNIAEELRGFERILQHGVQLLTPFSPPLFPKQKPPIHPEDTDQTL